MMSKSSVLVTGGAGFVGSALVRRLVLDGYEVAVFDNFCRGHRSHIAGLPVKLYLGDVCAPRAMGECLQKVMPQVVFHLAAMHFIPDCNRRPTACIRTNVVGTENMLKAAAEVGVERVICPTSMAVYPITDEKVTEKHPVGPYDIYGETKVMNEMQLGRWARKTGGSAVAVRLANVYGPRETNAHVLPAIMDQLKAGKRTLALGDITPYRDYIHSDDTARGFAALGRTKGIHGFDVFNLGSGREHSVRDILDVLGELLGEPIEVKTNARFLRKIERMHLWPDISKIKKVTGWKPKVKLKDGLRELCLEYGLKL
jgi:UDP-glucose 4-epimerase